jgi:ABC-type lipoprotein export system ATPase subunit/predicted GNAT family N-acyltransferase
MVLVIGVLGAWGKGKTITLTMLQDLVSSSPRELGLPTSPYIVSNFMSRFTSSYIGIAPSVKQVLNPYTKQDIPVIDFLEFLKRPRSERPIFLFLDDVYGWLASYFFGSRFNQTAFRLLASGRKKNINIAESSVRFKDVDPRLRALHTHLFIPRFSSEYQSVLLERYVVDAFEDRRIQPDVWFDARRYFDAYDTNEVIESVYDMPLDFAPARSRRAVVAVASNGRTETQTPPPPVQRLPKGREAQARGHQVQGAIAQEYRDKGLFVRDLYEEGDPDIVLYGNKEMTIPTKVISVKAFYLVPSWMRYTSEVAEGPVTSAVTPFSSETSEEEKKMRHAVARTIYRRDVAPELDYAVAKGVPCELVVVNLRNSKRESITIDSSFQYYTTSQELNRDEKREQEAKGVTIERKSDQKGFSVGLDVVFSPKSDVTTRTAQVSDAYGIGLDETQKFAVYQGLTFDIYPGDVGYITGDSGSGKSLLLRYLKGELEKLEDFGGVVDGADIQIPEDEVLVEGVGKDTDEAIYHLSMAGLSEAFLMTRRYGELSDGQKYRYRIAKMLYSGKRTLILDEFGATLDRETAKVIAWLLQKVVRHNGGTLVVATTHRDLFDDLNPTLYVLKKFGPEADVKRFDFHPRFCSIHQSISIRPGTRQEIEGLELFHYRGKLSSFQYQEVFVAERTTEYASEVVGGIVYSSTFMNLRARNYVLPMYSGATDSSKGEALNKEVLRISRVIVLPKFRGIGLASRIVRETMPLVNRPYVETLAVMARYNPFFEKAGMVRINAPEKRDLASERALERLEQLGFDLDLLSSFEHVRAVLEQLTPSELDEVSHFALKTNVSDYFKKGMNLKPLIEQGDLDAIAQSFKLRKLKATYLIWKNPAFRNYPNPVVPKEGLVEEMSDENETN